MEVVDEMKIVFVNDLGKRTQTHIITTKRFSRIKRRIFYRSLTPAITAGVELDRWGLKKTFIVRGGRYL